MRDVVVPRACSKEVIAISQEAGVLGEAVTVEMPTEEAGSRVRARIVESLPVVVNGTVRHRLRLETIVAAS